MLNLPEFTSTVRRQKADHLQTERNSAKLIQLLWKNVKSNDRTDPAFLQMLVRCSWTTSSEEPARRWRNGHLCNWLGLNPKTTDFDLATELSLRLGVERSRVSRLVKEHTGISNYYTPLRTPFLKALRKDAEKIKNIFYAAARTATDQQKKVRSIVSAILRLPTFRAPNGGKAQMLNGLTPVLACLDPRSRFPIINQRTTALLRLIDCKADEDGAEALTLLIGKKNIGDAFDLDVYGQNLSATTLKIRRPRKTNLGRKARTLRIRSELNHIAEYARRRVAVTKKHDKLTNNFEKMTKWKYIVEEDRYDAFIRN